jgi:hypothetical protein
MALDRFKAAPLPNPPAQWDPQYMRQVIRVLETYFSQLDSRAFNNSEQYSADRFIGGSFSGTSISADDVNTTTLEFENATGSFLSADGVTTTALIATGLRNEVMVGGSIMANHYYGGRFYGDGRFLETPYNQFWSDQDQAAVSVDAAYALTLNQNDFPNGISVVSNSQITVSDEGLYLINYSIQVKNTTNDVQDIDIWFRKNLTDIPDSNSRFSLPARKSSGNPSHLIAVTPFMVDLAANDYVEIMWRVTDVGVSIEHFPAVAASPGVTPAIPATPSAIVNITFISAQHPPVKRVAPLPVFGFGQVGDISVVIR